MVNQMDEEGFGNCTNTEITNILIFKLIFVKEWAIILEKFLD